MYKNWNEHCKNVPIEQYVNEKEQYKMKKVTQKSSTVWSVIRVCEEWYKAIVMKTARV